LQNCRARNIAPTASFFSEPPNEARRNVMLFRTSTIAACVLALSGGAALAQNQHLPAAPPGNVGPGGSTGTGTVGSIGTDTPNADQAAPGTNSTSVLSHTNKAQSAAGAPQSNYSAGEQSRYAGEQSGYVYTGYTDDQGRPVYVYRGAQAQPMYSGNQASADYQADARSSDAVRPSAQGPRETFIVDEYGRHYNRQGQRIR
jgi:hypothetical protein